MMVEFFAPTLSPLFKPVRSSVIIPQWFERQITLFEVSVFLRRYDPRTVSVDKLPQRLSHSQFLIDTVVGHATHKNTIGWQKIAIDWLWQGCQFSTGFWFRVICVGIPVRPNGVCVWWSLGMSITYGYHGTTTSDGWKILCQFLWGTPSLPSFFYLIWGLRFGMA